MIKFTNFSAGLFRVFVGNGNKGDSVTFQSNTSKYGRTRQTYVSKGKFRFVDLDNNVNYLTDSSINNLSERSEYKKLPHLTPITIKLIAEEDNSQLICVNYKNKKNVKEVLFDEFDLSLDESVVCFKNDFVLVKSGCFYINDVKYNDMFYAHVISNIITITAITNTKVIRFYV